MTPEPRVQLPGHTVTPAARHGPPDGLPSVERCSLAGRRLHPDPPSVPSSPAPLLCDSRMHFLLLLESGVPVTQACRGPVASQETWSSSAFSSLFRDGRELARVPPPICAGCDPSGETQSSSQWDTPSPSVSVSLLCHVVNLSRSRAWPGTLPPASWAESRPLPTFPFCLPVHLQSFLSSFNSYF